MARPLRRRMTAPLRLGGLLMAALFVWESMRPTLLPRPWLFQGVITGISAAIGYGVGALGSVLVALVRNRRGATDPLATQRVRPFAWAALGLATLVGAALWPGWQSSQRELVEMDDVALVSALPVLLVAVVVALLFLAIGRILGHGIVLLDRWLAHRVPRPAAHAMTAATGVVLVVLFVTDVIVDPLISAANASFGTLDDTTEEGIVQPQAPEISGSPASLAPWDTLGFQGRTFVGRTSTLAELEATAGPDVDVVQPIRAYVGLQTADGVDERAALAVDELERTGAFDRSVLVIATVTGTGWINPVAARALEHLHHGDTAIVGMQYSYLPSWISFIVDKDKAAATGQALIGAVQERWAELPEDERPLLVAFGESLGSFGSEHAFVQGDAEASVARITELVDRALWMGPTGSNPIRGQLIDGREPGSPAWLPVVAEDVMFVNTVDELAEPGIAEVLYRQHPSDPVGWWEPATLWREPAWLQGERGYDVPDRARWFPFVTWLQTTFDLIEGFSAPAGYGHNYDDGWVQAWAAIAPPAGWTAADTEALAEALAGA